MWGNASRKGGRGMAEAHSKNRLTDASTPLRTNTPFVDFLSKTPNGGYSF